MYSAPDFVKVELMQKGVYASLCVPGYKMNDVDYGGHDMSGCVDAPMAKEQLPWQCYYVSDPPDDLVP